MSDVIEISDDNFKAEVLDSSLPVLVDFWAPRCGPCRIIAPTIEELATESKGKFKICKLNVDDCQQTAIRYNIASIPTLMVFNRGMVSGQYMGVQSKERLQSALEDA